MAATTLVIFYNLDEICLEKWGDAKYYEKNTGAMTAAKNICNGMFTSDHPGSTIDDESIYYTIYNECMLKYTIYKHNNN